MPKDDSSKAPRGESHGDNNEEVRSLLSGPSNDNDPEDGTDTDLDHGPASPSYSPSPPPPPPPRRHPVRQSSISHAPMNGSPRTPRTPNRVRFELDDRTDNDARPNGHFSAPSNRSSSDWMEDEDHLASESRAAAGRGSRRDSSGQRAPLLTDIEAPSVTLASEDFNAEDLLESARPKSGMRSAFMNMANSIM